MLVLLVCSASSDIVSVFQELALLRGQMTRCHLPASSTFSAFVCLNP